jgi:hypothetical protein
MQQQHNHAFYHLRIVSYNFPYYNFRRQQVQFYNPIANVDHTHKNMDETNENVDEMNHDVVM